MIIFPLSTPGKIVLILIAIVLGLIYWMMLDPGRFRRMMRGEKGWWRKQKKEEEKRAKK